MAKDLLQPDCKKGRPVLVEGFRAKTTFCNTTKIPVTLLDEEVEVEVGVLREVTKLSTKRRKKRVLAVQTRVSSKKELK